MAWVNWAAAVASGMAAVAQVVAACAFHGGGEAWARNAFLALSIVWGGLAVFWASRGLV